MKIQVVSDLHLEFGTISIENTGADTLILSGDICLANELNERDAYSIMGEHTKSNRYHTFFQECSARFKHVIYVSGNHEHYHGDIALSHNRLKTNLAYLKNIHVLEKETIVIDDITFIAGTLWTDMNKEDPITLSHIKGVMNDYRIIDDSNEKVTYRVFHALDKEVGITDDEWLAMPVESRHRVEFKQRSAKFSPEKSVQEHKGMMEVIRNTLSSLPVDAKVVIVGHHAPCKLSTKPRYQGEHIMNGAYSSDLTELMLDNPKIKLWTHGHTHSTFDYMIGSTRIVCNPRGYYSYEENEEFDPGKIFEV